MDKCHVPPKPADCYRLLVCIRELEAKVERLREARKEALEVYAGMEGFEPKTAPEGYCLRIIDQMAKALFAQEGEYDNV